TAGSSRHSLEGLSVWIFDQRFSPVCLFQSCASRFGTAKLWNTDGSLIHSLEGHSDAVWNMRFSPDGNTLATASSDGTAKLWPWELDMLMSDACRQMRGYLLSSPNVQSEDKKLCD
ncbi:MAG: hypothetical protein AAGC93_21540, partial [Cyanobacteria bacterium P01_F01_bin.53]